MNTLKDCFRYLSQQLYFAIDSALNRKPLFFENSLKKTIRVDQIGDQMVLSFGGKVLQSYTHQSQLIPSVWTSFLLAPYFSKTGPMIVLGFGGGSIVRLYRDYFPSLTITGVEIDPVVVMIAQKYFDIPKRTQVVVDDAVQFVQNTSNQYAIIVIDLFDADKTIDFVWNRGFLTNVSARLSQNGVIVINFVGNDKNRDIIVSYFKEEGYLVYCLPLKKNDIKNSVLFVTQRSTIGQALKQINQEKNQKLQTFALSLAESIKQM